MNKHASKGHPTPDPLMYLTKGGEVASKTSGIAKKQEGQHERGEREQNLSWQMNELNKRASKGHPTPAPLMYLRMDREVASRTSGAANNGGGFSDNQGSKTEAQHRDEQREVKGQKVVEHKEQPASKGKPPLVPVTKYGEAASRTSEPASARGSFGNEGGDFQVGTDLKVIVFPKSDLDKANKDTGKHYPPGFEVHVVLSELASDHVQCEVPEDEESDTDSDDTNLSDTDPEEEWDTPIKV